MREEPYVSPWIIHKSDLLKKKKPILSRLDIELTERCNNNCAHCYINLPKDDREAARKELSTAQWKGILKEAAGLGCMSVRFTGGEPLLREDFEELYVFARKAGLMVLVFTNAALITPRLAGLFKRIPPLEKIEVTVYGMSKGAYEAATRTDGSFEAAWHGINLLLRNRIPFVVKGALLSFNEREMDEFEKWAAAIPWMHGRSPAYSMFFNLRGRRDGRKNELIKKLRPAPEEGLRIFARRKEDYVKGMKEFCSKFMRVSGDRLFSCGAGRGGCVDAYGFFQPCMLLRHPDTVYNLAGGSLEDALVNFFPKIRGMKAVNPEYLSRCARCFLKGLCEQCPAKSWMEHGTLDTPVEYFCGVAHAQARFFGLLKERENAWEVRDWEERLDSFVKSGQEARCGSKN
ncbi:MAG: radical SAM protein [Candidatus Omnitrophota bacterium]